MILDIVLTPETILYQRAEIVREFDADLHELIDNMKETMQHHNAVGLAAQQVGVLQQVIVVEYKGKYQEVINPGIQRVSRGKSSMRETCLSEPGYYAIVERPKMVFIACQDRDGNYIESMRFADFEARIIMHELDHLGGVLLESYGIVEFEKDEEEENG